jgi:rSAM/selenodomain-associated transferase 2
VISVIIPTLNEQSRIERALASAAAPEVERIVVDAGSSDATRELARRAGADAVLDCAPGRALQLGTGARAASGDVLLFLHADSALEPGWSEAVLGALADPRVAGGAFRLRFDAPGAGFRAIELGVRLRSRLLGLPYGDQGLFVRRAVLEAAGGIAPVPIFEDLDLVRAIRARGRLALVDLAVHTSARRYERNGILLQVARNNAALVAYFSSFDRARVARWYRRSPPA